MTCVVCAGDPEDLYRWSNTGPCVDVFAPGVDIYSACGGQSRCQVVDNMSYTYASGTSMAVPHVAGQSGKRQQWQQLQCHRTALVMGRFSLHAAATGLQPGTGGSPFPKAGLSWLACRAGMRLAHCAICCLLFGLAGLLSALKCSGLAGLPGLAAVVHLNHAAPQPLIGRCCPRCRCCRHLPVCQPRSHTTAGVQHHYLNSHAQQACGGTFQGWDSQPAAVQ